MNSRELLRQLYIGIGITVLLFALVGAIFMRPIWLYEAALFVGGVCSCFLLYHTYDCLDRALDMQAKSARAFITLRVLFRLVLRAGLLILGILIDWSAFVGVAIGLMSMKISAFINPIIKKYRIAKGIISDDSTNRERSNPDFEDSDESDEFEEDGDDMDEIDRVVDTLDIENNK